MVRPWVPPVSALWALITAYALVRDRLADLGAALGRSLARMITLTVLTVPFVYLLLQAEEAYAGSRYFHFSIVTLLAFAAAAVLVPPIRQIANERLDRLIGARSTHHRRALLDFSRQAASFTDAGDLTARARFELTATSVCRRPMFWFTTAGRSPARWLAHGRADADAAGIADRRVLPAGPSAVDRRRDSRASQRPAARVDGAVPRACVGGFRAAHGGVARGSCCSARESTASRSPSRTSRR
jgi:hypothetical protein